ncbi:hypothetical protein V6x_44260 [Gimesia chilikensis]|uniref:Uncharacterized protein n=1 Tax=Gimesia chilikensis TaxID=2605989 RepID=A0A517WHH0_9PLAN|nr:hypothetical protein [Gimesia chilikensis]QDU04696.1 hypothetical protein V6x_44260 [Gimesia chilikensis]
MTDPTPEPRSRSPWAITSLVCSGVVLFSVLACVALAAWQSEGLTQVKVTALDAGKEPRDHGIPLLKQKEALPDYEVQIVTQDLFNHKLGARPNQSATDGLVWNLSSPVAIHEIVGIRLLDQDQLVSDTLVEVPFSRQPIEIENYRLEIQTAHSAAVGVNSFFRSPLGVTIATAFVLAIIVICIGLFL